MGFDPFDSTMQRLLADMDLIRRATGSIPDAVQQIQQDFAARQELQRQLEDRWEIVRRIEESQELVRQLEQRNAAFREIEERHELYRRIGQGSELAALSELFRQHRSLIDSYAYGTLYGGGPASVGLLYGLGSFGESNAELADSYEEVSDLLAEEEGKISSDVQAMSTVEVFASAEVVAELDIEPISEDEEDKEEIEERQQRRQLRQEIHSEAHQQLLPALEALDPRLVKMWDGGLMAISGTNPDRVRHFTASLRELLTKVLHILAPDEEIRKWSSDPDLYDKDRPTRRGRMRYICRSIDQPAFQGFVTIDYKVLLETIDLFHKGTHLVEAGFSKEQLSVLETRTAQTLLFLLQIGQKDDR